MILKLSYKNNSINKVYCLVTVFFLSLSYLELYSQQKDKFVVVLDAGHGGKDPGYVAFKRYKEKDIALKITLAVGRILEKNRNIEAIYTREKDVFVELSKRADIANKNKADLFISIHCNAHGSKVSGAETFVLGVHESKRNFEISQKENSAIFLEDNYKERYDGFNPNSPESVIGLTLLQEEYLDESLKLASLIQSAIVDQNNLYNRKVKQAGFLVLRNTFMPSILIETGFISNKNEVQYLSSKKGQEKIGASIAQAIVEYIDLVKKNTVQGKAQSINNGKKKYKDVIFKVQIASGSRDLGVSEYNFKGLKGVERIKESGIYKYYFGSTSDFSTAQIYRDQAKDKGFDTAFIVAFKNGKKISLQRVFHMLKE